MTPTEDMEQQQAINNAASKEPPTTEQLKAELRHEKYKRSFVFSLRNTIFTLVTVAAAALLIAVLVMPVLQIYGSSMTSLFTNTVPSSEMSTQSPGCAITRLISTLLL